MMKLIIPQWFNGEEWKPAYIDFHDGKGGINVATGTGAAKQILRGLRREHPEYIFRLTTIELPTK